MVSAWSTPHPESPQVRTIGPVFQPLRWRAEGETWDIALLRQRDPDQLLVAGRCCVARDTWEQHCRQRRDIVLVASRRTGATHQVLGMLEMHAELAAEAPPREGMIDRLFVLPEHRRRGIGTRLMCAAITFARANMLAALREHIPNILIFDPGTAAWCPHIPTGDGFGGLRSLGATLNACAMVHQYCRVARTTRQRVTRYGRTVAPIGTLGAILELPIARTVPGTAPGYPLTATSAALALLVENVARHAGVVLACEERGTR